MKKNISINIGGIIFHIEEDGFENLKNYLDAINQYFSDFEDSQEIINDIENRIAEIFLSKLKDDKQVIEKEDVASLMDTLGSIEDFKTAEEQQKIGEEEPQEQTYQESASGEKKLFRDTKRNVFGGVAAGIAHYFSIDVLWIRLLFIIAFLGLLPFQAFSPIILLGYVLCWIFLPSNKELKDDDKVKKLYRSEDRKVIGGVAGGLAAYFGTDVAIIRILFVLSLIPGGAGLIIYLVLWFITPTAKTVTEKMQMEGTPITLSNIEKNIKSSLKVENGEETTLVKILLFPFRLIAIVLNGLAKALGPVLNFVVDAIRVIAGVVFSALGLGFGVMTIILFAISQGVVFESDFMQAFDIPHEVIANTVSLETIFVSFLAIIIPAIFLIIAGVSIIAKKWVLNKTVGFSLLAVWFMCVVAAAILVPATALNFKEEGSIIRTETYDIGDKTLVLNVNEVGYDDFEVTEIRLRGYDGKVLSLEKTFKAKGKNRLEAEENAGMMTHQTQLKDDSVLWIDSNIQFKEGAVFRGNELDMQLNIPYGKKFIMDRKMKYILRSTLYIDGYSSSQIPDNTWMITEEGLQCLTCEEKKGQKRTYYNNDDPFFISPFNIDDDIEGRVYEIDNFNKISGATGLFLEIRKGEDYQLQVFAEDRDDLKDFNFEVSNGWLDLGLDDDHWDWDWGYNEMPQIKCVITVPNLSELSLSSAATAHLIGWNGKDIDIDLNSAARLYGEMDFEEITLDMSSAAKAKLRGKANRFNVSVSSAASLDAYELTAKEADVEVSSAGSAEVNVTDYLNAEANSGGDIEYKGNPRINADSNSGGDIDRD